MLGQYYSTMLMELDFPYVPPAYARLVLLFYGQISMAKFYVTTSGPKPIFSSMAPKSIIPFHDRKVYYSSIPQVYITLS